MTVRATKKRSAWEELCALPENLVGEIIDGELIVSPRPAGPHAYASSALGGELFGPFSNGRGGPGGWWILSEPELHLGDDVFVPDWAGWRRSRLPSIDVVNFTVAPDWVCEILSPNNRRTDLVRKLPKYAGYKVNFAWIIDPDGFSLQAYARSGSGWKLDATYTDDDKVRARPFDAVEWELGLLWLPERRQTKRSTRVPKTKRH